MADDYRDIYGALAGWSCQDLGEKLILKVQAIEPGDAEGGDSARSIFLLLTKSQASIFANYLTEVSGYMPPKRRHGLFSRLFARLR